MDFLGMELNSRIRGALSEAVDAGKLPHAVVLEGGSESDRAKLARLLGAAMVCEAAAGKPCRVCTACIKSFAGSGTEVTQQRLEERLSHPDIAEVRKDPKLVRFSIRMIRTLKSETYIVPNEAAAKVYILFQAHLLTPQAQNALLKILEEPPPYICFILEGTSKSVLLPTVLSRAAVFSLGQLDESADIKNKKLEQIVSAASALAVAAAARNEAELMRCAALFVGKNEFLGQCLDELNLIVRDAVCEKVGGPDRLSSCKDCATLLAGRLKKEELTALMDQIALLKQAVNTSTNNNLLISLLSARLSLKV